MDEDDFYDEFGNYIGPELEDSEAESEEEYDERPEHGQELVEASLDNQFGLTRYDENKIVLHEDKKYYPDASEVYPGVRTITLDEDAQDLSEPIIKPIKVKSFSILEKTTPPLNYTTEFLTSLMNAPHLIRNVAILGSFHHGKTTFVDTLVMATQVNSINTIHSF